MLLDRLLETAELQVLPLAIYDIRRGARVELAALSHTSMHCVVRGRGALQAAGCEDVALSEAAVAIVPQHMSCALEPLGGSARALRVEAAGRSDHVAKLVAGAGDPGLLVVSASMRAAMRPGADLFQALATPLVVDLSDLALAPQLLQNLLQEHEQRLAANRRMTELLLQQLLLHALRKLQAERDCPLPWLLALRDAGLSRALNAILRTPQAPHSLRSMAAAAGMSRTVFNARFTQAFGRAPLELLEQVRMREALELLRTTDLSVASIASRVGISTRGALARELAAASAHAPRWLGPVGSKIPRGSA